MITKRINTYNFEFVRTCEACPEQYDVFLEGEQVGYVRLRWGYLRCDYLECNGPEIYSYDWDDGWLGTFPNDEEREFHLEKIALCLYNKILESETVR